MTRTIRSLFRLRRIARQRGDRLAYLVLSARLRVALR